MDTIVIEEKEFYEILFRETGMLQEQIPNMDSIYSLNAIYIRKGSDAEIHETNKKDGVNE